MNNSQNSIIINNDSTTIVSSKKSSGRPRSKVWEHFTAGSKVSDGHFSAICNWCDSKWAHAEWIIMERHLANHYTKAPPFVIQKYIH